MNDSKNVKTHQGGCHCGAVRYQVELDASAGTRCNCSICAKLASIGSLVKPAAFKLLAGADSATAYEWGHKVGKRYFCKVCGVSVYGAGYLEEMGGAWVSVNLTTIDGIDTADVKLMYWDGRHDNWQAGPRATPWPVHASPDRAGLMTTP